MKQILGRQGHTCFQKPLRAERRLAVTCDVHRQPNAQVKDDNKVSRRLVLTSISIIPSLSLWASAQAGENSPAAVTESAASSAATEVRRVVYMHALCCLQHIRWILVKY